MQTIFNNAVLTQAAAAKAAARRAARAANAKFGADGF